MINVPEITTEDDPEVLEALRKYAHTLGRAKDPRKRMTAGKVELIFKTKLAALQESSGTPGHAAPQED